MLETHIDDYWNVDGDRELSDAWTGLTRFIFLNEKPPDGYTWFGRDINKKTDDLEARQCVAGYVESYV